MYEINHTLNVLAIDDISFTLPKSGMIFFVGKSGCGKSTLLNLMGGIDQPTYGSITINSKEISALTRKDLDLYRLRNVGFVFQDLNLIETLSIKDNIAISLELNGIHCEIEKINDVLRTVDLENYSSRMPSTLSGGQRQRVAIARALIKSPQIILADEPTGSLDSETSKQIFDLLKTLSKSNLVIIASHDLEFANTYGDRIIELKDGKIVKDTNPIFHDDQVENISFPTVVTKSSLPIRRALQLSTHYIKLKKFKLFLTLLLSLLTFILFGLFDSLGNYDVVNNTINSIYDYQNHHVFVQKVYKQNENIEDTKPLPMSFDDLEYYQEKYPHLSIIPIMDSYHYYYTNTLFDIVEIDENQDLLEARGGVSITQNMLDLLGYDLTYGHLPVNENQVLISLHTFELYKTYGYKDQDSHRVDINNYADIDGLHLVNDQFDFEIVGIIDTHLDLSKFQKLWSGIDLNTIERITLIYEYEGLIQGGLHAYLFMHENVIENHKIQYELSYDISSSSTNTTMIFQSSSPMISEFVLGKFAKMTTQQTSNQMIWIEEELDELTGYQIVLPTSAILQNTQNAEEISTTMNESINQFALENYDEIQEAFEENEVGTYASYIRFSTENLYHPGYTNEYFLYEAIKSWVSVHLESYLHGDILLSSLFTSSNDVEVVGFMDDLTTETYYQIYISDSLYVEIISKHHFHPLNGAVFILSGDVKEDRAFLTEVTSHDKSIYYVGINPVLTTAKIYHRVLSDFSLNLLYIGMILVIISTLQLFNLVSSSISYKKKEIGILRSLGGRMSDMVKIFYSESLIIGFISGVLAILFNIIINLIVNQYLVNQYGTPVKILIFGYRQIIIIFLLLLATTTLSALFPVYFYAKKHPIETIRLP
jgi:ABC-type lipoprotein export system ATPase subunit